MDERPPEITQLLKQWRCGDAGAEARLFEVLMPDLHRIAASYFRGEREGHTLQPTALVNEGFLRLAAAKGVDWQDRGHFFVIAARIMRRCLIDHARARPEVQFLSLEGLPEGVLGQRGKLETALAIDGLLEEMGAEFPQRCSVVEMKFFLGMTDEEAADALGLSLHTLQREWYRARRWLFEKLNSDEVKPGQWNKAPNTTNAS
ncbi:MAG: polymerase, sigma subunit, family [Candidatus Solibacter sp.]|nr:polymerase, sigma subunit, family [Candidatus Solibacter sp.]